MKNRSLTIYGYNRTFLKICLAVCFCCLSFVSIHAFRFAQISDTHIRPNHSSIRDLSQSVRQINAMDSVDFVIFSGDITHRGDKESLLITKSIIDSLNVPYYIIPGNHDTKFGEQCIYDFIDVFGAENFVFTHESCVFIGLNTGQLKVSNGAVSDANLQWLDSVMSIVEDDKAIFLVTHHPIQPSDIDNWQQVGEIVTKHGTDFILSGHYHINMLFKCVELPDVITRTNQSNETRPSGFSIITVGDDVITWEECNPDGNTDLWLQLPFLIDEESR